ncbi:Hpt domain-containing protein [Vibrio bathopelagicus]|uniref:Hpt domain-containing protein n=1 Tax=Vibrio bathopelagicus TaxID=2777577 RepID=UPI0018643009|nr:Hpt domain-containing protein [Vibrio bathopelagicus]
MEKKLNIGNETSWLSNYPSDQRVYLADVYVSVMQEDLEQLRDTKPKRATTLQVMHRIKGGLSSIGHFPLEQLIKVEEKELKAGNNTVEQTNLNTIKLISHSVQSIEDWLNTNSVGN